MDDSTSGMDEATNGEEFEAVLGEESNGIEEFDSLFGIVADGVVGAAGGLVGTAAMTVVLLIAESVGAFSRESFAQLAQFGIESVLTPVALGYLVFLLGGMVPWPLLFASLKEYLPGGRDPVKGVVFGTILWTGFAPAFYAGYTGSALVLYAAATLLAHWVYGFALGSVFEYLSTRPDSLV
ncbi:DUF6789 family protein [Halalkalicoccus jeotgali]|uniref:Uncharacterized protein n=1 Tax=Halalkalicoccus jeotgali (strain DSM 18796 / CECT 7217 / JCM 14584 / KCTC 4019 / B3) TaxID=795797 RepID=D8J2P8_HALJB|nr:DUF6789 family protein [Halalkalicoccus jeotgali]ADJ15005.1 hypothetical protein HacjB3_08100 [Halalkalicoccus jeotgali B3]ELY34979.1 hypothetical protein C497_14622 [Halalkalicoccus jeotgali B3]